MDTLESSYIHIFVKLIMHRFSCYICILRWIKASKWKQTKQMAIAYEVLGMQMAAHLPQTMVSRPPFVTVIVPFGQRGFSGWEDMYSKAWVFLSKPCSRSHGWIIPFCRNTRSFHRLSCVLSNTESRWLQWVATSMGEEAFVISSFPDIITSSPLLLNLALEKKTTLSFKKKKVICITTYYFHFSNDKEEEVLHEYIQTHTHTHTHTYKSTRINEISVLSRSAPAAAFRRQREGRREDPCRSIFPWHPPLVTIIYL